MRTVTPAREEADAPARPTSLPADVPLCVRLEGVLIRSTLLDEAIIAGLRRRPMAVLRAVAGGGAERAALVGDALLDPASLPYREEVLTRLRAEHARGRRILLVTEADEPVGSAVADHLGLFSAIVARASAADPRLAGIDGATPEHLAAPDSRNAGRLRGYVSALRVHQWVKNALVFAPLVASHNFTNPRLVAAALLAFAAFCACASAVYVLNDLLDIAADRRHPRKRRRAFASGAVPAAQGLAMLPVLVAIAVGLGALLPPAFLVVLLVYAALTLAYSLALKSWLAADIVALAAFYVLRIVAGGAAIGILPSAWLLAFAMFLFTSLAFAKRYAELLLFQDSEDGKLAGRAYAAADLRVVESFGTTSGYISVLVLALYLNSLTVGTLYSMPSVLWFLCPILLYWQTRLWFLAARGQMIDDPVVFALRDPASGVVAALCAIVFWFAL
jgi:4-hydroxybenzoate polyprenyltransferase